MRETTRQPAGTPAPTPAEAPCRGATDLCPRDPSPAELGRRIKMLRIARGLTLKALEERGGISATHVSEIERGRASPTVGALGRIARALGLRPATLVEPDIFPEVSVIRTGERAARRIRLGTATLEPVTGPVHGAQLGAQLLTLPIGREAAFAHRHEGEEWATVLAGAAEVRVGDESRVLREGDSLHFRAHHEHSYANLTSSPAVLLVVSRPRACL